jgi:hypothetical protein
MNQVSTREQFKERLGFDEWGRRQPGEPTVFFLHFFLTGLELGNWELVRSRLPVEEEGVIAQKWFWEPVDGKQENVRIHLDTFECPSQTAAHEQVVSLLGHVQGPQFPRLEDGPGTVSFGPEDSDAGVIMARGNLTLRLLNAGEEIVDVRDLAAQLDESLNAPPEPPHKEAAGPRFDVARLKQQADTRQLLLEAEDPIQEKTVGFRIFSTGEISRSDSQLQYQPPAKETDQLRIYALTRLGGVTETTLEVREE